MFGHHSQSNIHGKYISYFSLSNACRLHTKLLAGNLAQILVTAGIGYVAYTLMNYYANLILATTQDALTSAEIYKNPDCFSKFDVDNCFFPASDDGSLGLAFCSEIFLPNQNCEQGFVEASGNSYDEFCEMFQDSVDEFSLGVSVLFGEETCPPLYMPYPQAMGSFTIESTEASYCASPLMFCTAPVKTGDGLSFDVCAIGASSKTPIPFQFVGDACPNYPEMSQVLEDRERHKENLGEFWPPEKWM